MAHGFMWPRIVCLCIAAELANGTPSDSYAMPCRSCRTANYRRLAGTASVSKQFSDAEFARHIQKLRKRLPATGFNIVIQSPFVVIGNETQSAVRLHAQQTVQWAVDRLKRDFFVKDPHHILDIWLFKDEASYTYYAKALFRDTPDTPYGYYSPAHKALIMNISTGGGTLVHEIVHPFMEANFPACPPWFNEGLGSLYEQSGDLEGHIHGYPNWRLPELQKAIHAGLLPSFQTLMEMDADAFYNEDRGTNYGQSRYLCYYLQEKGLLIPYYHAFAAHQSTDPSGFKTLQSVLGRTDMNEFQSDWEQFVLALKFSPQDN